MANPAPTINQINAFNATQGTTIDFNIIGGTELVRSNRIYIYDLSDNSLICTHLYVSTESIHELPPNTDGSIVYESGKSSADFVNGAQYYAQIQTFTDIAGTEGGSGLSVAKMFWCLVDPTLTITTIPSTISTTSYNVSATYDANTSVVSNIIQQYQFSLYSATGSLLQSSGVVVGSGTQQGTSTAYDISYNFTGLSVGSSYYVVVDVTTTQGMSVTTQSNTFMVSIDTPTLGEATVVNNACDGYISVTSNLSSEYGGSGSGEIVSFETDSENVFTKLQVDLEPIQDLHGYDKPWVGGAGKNKFDGSTVSTTNSTNWSVSWNNDVLTIVHNNGYSTGTPKTTPMTLLAGTYCVSYVSSVTTVVDIYINGSWSKAINNGGTFTVSQGDTVEIYFPNSNASTITYSTIQLEQGSTATSYAPYSNICPISGHDEVGVGVVGKNWMPSTVHNTAPVGTTVTYGSAYRAIYAKVLGGQTYTLSRDVVTGNRFRVYVTVEEPTNGTLVESVDAGADRDLLLSKTFTIPNGYNYVYVYLANDGSTITSKFQLELGSTATDYAPYTAETIHQDIEATYTPTVQENEPYQFKRTGDVGGDRETIELVGGSVAWNQLINNGNFASDSNWSTSNATKTINNGICTFTATAYNGNICTSNPSRIFPSTANNHKYFALAEVKLTTATTDVVLRLNGGYKEVKTASNTNWQTLATVYNLANSDNGYVQIMDKRTSGWDSVQVKTIMVVDLTQMFGSTIADYIYTLEQGQAGAGVAFFRKYFPKPYYPYDAGTIKSVEGVSAHKTVGFNQFDEEWELGTVSPSTGEKQSSSTRIRSKNYIPILPNTTYYHKTGASSSAGDCAYYDADKNYISGSGWFANNTTFTTPNGAYYMMFAEATVYGTTYNHDICINLSWDGERNGEYEPYVEHSYPLDDSLTLRGIPKIANGKLYYDGDTYESDGTVNRRFGIVDLSTLGWTTRYTETTNKTVSVDLTTAYKTKNGNPNLLCCGINYIGVVGGVAALNNPDNKSVGLYSYTQGVVGESAYSTLYVVLPKDSTPTGEILFELATPTTETAEPFESIQKVTPNYGTEEFVTTTNVPVGNNTQYYTRDIYGGTLDLVSGVLTVTHQYISDLSNVAFAYNGGTSEYTEIYTAINPTKANGISNIISNALETGNYGFGGINGRSGNGNIYFNVPPSMTAAQGKQWLIDNGVTICYELATTQTYQLTPQQIQTLVGVNNVWSEQGDVELSYHIPITNLLVKRQDVDDVSGNWLTLYSQPITQASDMDFTFIDFTNQYGKTYKYALVPLLTQTQSGVEVEVEGGYTVSDEVQSVFDGVFIADSTGSQKCKANVGYGNVDMNQTVGTITPIGSKYPVVITNSQNQYHNGSISGTIVPDDYYFNGNLSRVDMVNKRDELEQFLTNKRAKIIKDWNGKIWLVMIMDNVSCTFNNNYGMGIVNFSTNWVEVGDPTNQEDLQATGLINVGGV